jgi:hypothetical protein
VPRRWDLSLLEPVHSLAQLGHALAELDHSQVQLLHLMKKLRRDITFKHLNHSSSS